MSFSDQKLIELSVIVVPVILFFTIFFLSEKMKKKEGTSTKNK